ncbi:YciI family protein [Actinomyces sp.]|uniref:YciI family protein n=1 Tax=Actinomyces sp. TaxID=29317 RepID=UPI00289CC657|nr:YciI family protein [Actinomyces sp.]
MALFAVEYVYDPARTSEMDPVRPLHRAHLGELHGRGVNVASGPWVGGRAGALILVHADSEEAALDVLAEDPFFVQGFVISRTARQWNPVIGEIA